MHLQIAIVCIDMSMFMKTKTKSSIEILLIPKQNADENERIDQNIKH